MKRRIDGKVYVQRYDLNEIVTLEDTPTFVIDDICLRRQDYWRNDGSKETQYLFDQAFEGRAAEWILEQDWIIDFDEYKDKRWQEVFEAYFNLLASIEMNKDKKIPDTQRYKLEHKLTSLDLMRDYARGILDFRVPR